MKLIHAILFMLGGCCAMAQTNQAWLNASRLAVGSVPAARLGTNDASATDGMTLQKTGEKTKWVTPSETLAAYFTENDWAGPSNSITLGATNQYFFTAYTHCAVTGFTYRAGYVCPSVLWITNASGSNINFTHYASRVQEDTTNTYLIPSGYVLMSWMAYSRQGTNQVTRVFKR